MIHQFYETYQFTGGCIPSSTIALLKLTSWVLFIFKASTVALPDGVCPKIIVEVSSHRKCSFQTWVRGLKSAAVCSETGSIANVLVNLCPLQPLHE